jgi:hypothetical protein
LNGPNAWWTHICSSQLEKEIREKEKRRRKKGEKERKGKVILFLYCSFPSHVPIDKTNHM